jgi:hypothetical protein
LSGYVAFLLCDIAVLLAQSVIFHRLPPFHLRIPVISVLYHFLFLFVSVCLLAVAPVFLHPMESIYTMQV